MCKFSESNDMKKSLFIAAVALCVAVSVQAQPKSRPGKTADDTKKSETTLSERAKAQYTGQLSAPDDVVWKRDIYRTLDLTKEKNAALYYPVEPLGDRVNMFTLLIRLVADGKVPAYEYRSDGNELFTPENRYKVNELLDKFYIYFETSGGKYVIADADIPSGDVLSYFIKESTYYDQHTATTATKVTAICPVLHRSGDFGDEVTKYPMFWLNYDDVSTYFGMTPVMTSSYNNVSNMSLDDYFATHLYDGEIYKTANLQNRLLSDYCKNDTALSEERARIEGELRGFEHHLWGTEEPDTTAVDETQGRGHKARASRTSSKSTKATSAKSSTSKSSTRTTAKKEKAPKSTDSRSSGTYSVRRERR